MMTITPQGTTGHIHPLETVNPAPRFYLEPLSADKHSRSIYEIWLDPANLAGTGMETAPSLETTRVMIRDRSHSVKPGIENFAIMAGPKSSLYELVATTAPPKQQGDLERTKEEPAPKLIGWTGVVRVAPEEIGWYVTGPCRGLDVATEAVQAMLRRYWKAQPGTAEVIAYIREGNVASERVATKAGLVRVWERTLVKGSTLPNGQVIGCDHGVWVAKKPT